MTPINLVLPLTVLLFVLVALVGLLQMAKASKKEAALPTEPHGRLDALLAATFALGFFCLAFWRLDFPAKAIFDECYHSRTGMQYVLGQNPMEWTHPPLAKLLIAESLQVFGGRFDPQEGIYKPDGSFSKEAVVGWRFASVLFGSFSLALLYLLARAMTRNRTAAALATAMLALDGVFFVQSRIAMTNIFTVCFILLATLAAWHYRESGKPRWLLLLGLALGLAVATRWTTLYAVALLGIWLLWRDLPRVWNQWRVMALTCLGLSLVVGLVLFLVRFYRADPAAPSQFSVILEQLKWFLMVGTALYVAAYLALRQTRAESVALLALPSWYLLAFVVMPVALYLLSYVPYLRQGHDLIKVLDEQRNMWNYHALMKEGHPYCSPWWSWPLVLRPTWYEFGTVGPGDNRIVGIWCIGNVFLWWAAVPGLVVAAWCGFKEKHSGIGLAALMGLGLWLAWGVQPRSLIFMHYFFEALPFACIALGYLGARLWRTAAPDNKAILGVYGLLMVFWFCFYYPLLSALPVPRPFFEIHLWQRNNLWV